MIFWTLLTLGFVHGLNPDHISAISAFVFKQPDRKEAFFTAACFAAGHIATLFFVSLFLQGFFTALPSAYEHAAAFLSKILLAALALMLILDLLPSTMHKHPHGGDVNEHLHFHFLPSGNCDHHHLPLAAGGLLALSHIRLFLSAAILFHTTPMERFIAPLCFGAGLFTSMILTGAAFSLLHSSAKKYTFVWRAAQGISAAACMVTAFLIA